MKKLLPIVFIALLGAAMFTSCKKSSSTGTTCICTYKGSSTGGDTTVTYTTSPTSGTTLGSFCTSENAAVQYVYPTGGCHL